MRNGRAEAVTMNGAGAELSQSVSGVSAARERLVVVRKSPPAVVSQSDGDATAYWPVLIDDRLAVYREKLISEGRGVPARECFPDQPYLTAIAAEIGISQTQLSFPKRIALIKKMAEELGYEIVRSGKPDGPLTAMELYLNFELLCPAAAKEKKKILAALVATAKAKKPDKIEAVAALEIAIEKASGTRDRRILDLLKSVAVDLRGALDETGLPGEQRARLHMIMRRQGYSVAALCRQIGHGDHRRIQRILNGKAHFTPADQMFLEAVEDLLDQPRGSLSTGGYGRRGAGNTTSRYPQKYAHLSKAERSKIAPYLPTGFALLSDDRKEEHIDFARAAIAAQVTRDHAARVLLQAQPYRLTTPPEQLKRELDSLEKHYTSSHVPVGRRNNSREWRGMTAELRRSWLIAIMGFLCNGRPEAFRVKKEELTLLMLLDPKVVEAYFDFRWRRFQRALATVDGAQAEDNADTREIVTQEFIQVHRMIAGLFNADSGWLAQSAHRARRLRPIPSENAEQQEPDPDPDNAEAFWLLSPEKINQAQKDWAGACKEAEGAYKQCIKNHTKRIKISRDSHAPIRPILMDAHPERAFHLVIDGLTREFNKVAKDISAKANVLRDLIAIQLQAQLGFRSETFLALTYRADNMGHLRFENGSWWIRMSRLHFKNPTGPYFCVEGDRTGRTAGYRDFNMKLVDVGGLYANLRLYIDFARPQIMKEYRSESLFVAVIKSKKRKKKGDPSLTSGALAQLSMRLYKKHLIYNRVTGTGFPGMTSVACWHSWRHILATAVLKQTGNVRNAADAIQDSSEVCLKYYGQYSSHDRADDSFRLRTALLDDPHSGQKPSSEE